MNRIFLAGLLILVVILYGCTGSSTGNTVGQGTSLELSGSLENGVRVIDAKAFRYDFDPNPIIVNQGEKVKIVMTSTDTSHGFLLPDYNINVPLPVGRPTTIEFVADKQGSFPFLCSVFCGSGHGGMRGTLVVR